LHHTQSTNIAMTANGKSAPINRFEQNQNGITSKTMSTPLPINK